MKTKYRVSTREHPKDVPPIYSWVITSKWDHIRNNIPFIWLKIQENCSSVNDYRNMVVNGSSSISGLEAQLFWS